VRLTRVTAAHEHTLVNTKKPSFLNPPQTQGGQRKQLNQIWIRSHRKYRSEVNPFFDKKDMGTNISRQFLSFRKLINPEELSSIKIWTNELEDEIKLNRKYDVARPINLDPGYLTHCNLILASTKDYYHRIHLQNGIYAEVTLFYQHEVFKNLPWTYPDFQTEEYKRFFLKVRTLYAKDISNN